MVDNDHFNKMADYTDNQLADLVSDGNSDAFVELTARYMSLIRVKAAPFRSTMLEADDLCQEGLLGLLNAARTYDVSGKAGFRTYAGVCIQNRIIMAYRTSGRKNLPLNNAVSLNDDGAHVDISNCAVDPETLLMDSESFKAMQQCIRQLLSKLEQQVLMLYLGGCSYSEIAEKLRVTSKAVDNALQRVRLKLKQLL
ncbi:sigma-70 family RNA polymerase sigma factor [Caproiciproducens galactitolivorans]|uniref:Sigma-70 family RNA polymerase sigma factor n=1 Tax=Caproiciproducens galactitolivorans TaxID=642589 RepID=A0ABT4BQF8_9FIRM|nr:sigma-70 family RNA polymerase sigma factor [Caproiciproducens galactitolivorans]MCY1713070.1 sigma-70 family RNA polymerase sigma factor [Caproiciproducens galactitolivorans]